MNGFYNGNSSGAYNFSPDPNYMAMLNKEKYGLRKTASFVGIAALLFVFISKYSQDVLVGFFNFIGISCYVSDGTFYGESWAYWCIGIISSVLNLLIPALLLFFALGRPFELKRLFKAPNGMVATVSVPITLLVTIFTGVIMNIIMEMFSSVGLSPNTPDYPNPVNYSEVVPYLLLVTVIPAFFEEFMVRGVIMTSLRRYGDSFAVIMSAFIFGLLHGNILQFINAFIMGLFLGYFVIRSGSLLTSILIHFFNNLIYGCISYVPQFVEDQKVQVFIVICFYAVVIAAGIIALGVFFAKDKRAFRYIKPNTLMGTADKAFNAFTSIGMLGALAYFIFKIATNFTLV